MIFRSTVWKRIRERLARHGIAIVCTVIFLAFTGLVSYSAAYKFTNLFGNKTQQQFVEKYEATPQPFINVATASEEVYE